MRRQRHKGPAPVICIILPLDQSAILQSAEPAEPGCIRRTRCDARVTDRDIAAIEIACISIKQHVPSGVVEQIGTQMTITDFSNLDNGANGSASPVLKIIT